MRLILLLMVSTLIASVPAQASATLDSLVSTKHTLQVEGATLAYTATTGFIKLSNAKGEETARVFFVAYTKDGVRNAADRPLMFSFNGGPGSSSVWLHLGVIGPKRVDLGEEGWMTQPPFELIDNDQSWLPFTDVVFIDPVGTGFSRASGETEARSFHGVQSDIRSVGEAIRLYTTVNNRWRSPKYLVGESYGTTRAAGLSQHLQQRYGMYLNGVVLVSSILDFGTARFTENNTLPYALFLPTYTATAHYHQALSAEMQARNVEDVVQQAREFAMQEYLPMLMRGSTLTGEERQYLTKSLAELTGLSTEYLESTDNRINIHYFTKELLRDQDRTVGRLDSRYKGIDYNSAGAWTDYDPSYAAILGPYSTLLNAYVREDLEFEYDIPYEILTGSVRPWDWGSASTGFVNTGEELRQAMTRNPYLKVFVANGYYDLATPFFATEHTFNTLGLDESLQGNVTMEYYHAGHMMYLKTASLQRLTSHVKSFVESSHSGTK